MARRGIERGERERKSDSWGGPNLLGEMELPLHLRRDVLFFGGHQKKGAILGNCWSKKFASSPLI